MKETAVSAKTLDVQALILDMLTILLVVMAVLSVFGTLSDISVRVPAAPKAPAIEANANELSMDMFTDAANDVALLDVLRMDEAPTRAIPYENQNPEAASRVDVRTPDGSYSSDEITVDGESGEISVDAAGTAILLDNRNVVVYDAAGGPTVYPAVACRVSFTG